MEGEDQRRVTRTREQADPTGVTTGDDGSRGGGGSVWKDFTRQTRFFR